MTTPFNLRYQPINDFFLNAVFSANVQNADIETWYGEKTPCSQLRTVEDGETVTDFSNCTLPYGGELSKNNTKNVGWTARLQANYNKYFGEGNGSQRNVAAGFEASSAITRPIASFSVIAI